MSLHLKVPHFGTRTPSPGLFRRPHSRSNPKPLSEVTLGRRDRKRSNTVHFEYKSPQFEEIKSFGIQQRFPSDDLRLDKSLDSEPFMVKGSPNFDFRKVSRSLSSRRRSSPAQVISKIQERLSKSSSNLSADSSPSRSAKTPSSDELSPSVTRNFMREGAVHLSTGVSSLNRYMFLFSDLLLIAKPKSTASFKLKYRLPVSELWIQNAIEGVTESNVAAERSFVIGWPTVSYVATFSTPEDKSLWWNVLKKTIDEQRTLECGKTVPVRILFRDQSQKNSAPLSLPVSNEDDVKSVVKMAMDGFGITGSEANEYQLWVVSGKESAAYPLMGHEIPFCIKMNHARQANARSSLSESEDVDGQCFSSGPKCEFILKKKKNSAGRLITDSPNSQKRWKSPMKSPIINWALNKKPQKQNSPELLSPQGSFFGLPLGEVAEAEDQLPTPVQDMLVELFRRGPSTVGIFRKSALMKSVKQLKQELDEGKIVNFEDKSAVVIATVFKEFLRTLPSSAFGKEYLEEMLATKEIADSVERATEIDKNLNKLPKVNQLLIKKFFCVLYHIARYSETNKMTSQNLAICIAPSLIWTSKVLKPSSPMETVSSCELVQFVIENYTEIFGEEATKIMGDESEIEPPFCYDDEEMPENSSDVPESPCKSPEEIQAKKDGFIFSLNVPDFNFSPNGSPTSSDPERKKSNTIPRLENGDMSTRIDSFVYGLKFHNRRHSENDLTDLNDNIEKRKMRARIPLNTYTTTAELISHQVNGHVDSKGNDPSSAVIKVVSNSKENSPNGNSRRKNSPSNQAIYHRKVRPTPSYEEAVKQLRRNNNFSPTFLRKFDENLESSDDSLDTKLDENRKAESSKTTADRTISQDPSANRRVKLERQAFVYPLSSPITQRLQSTRYAADEFRRRSPEDSITNSGRLRHPIAPASYEEHVQRRKRFEAAYLQKINLDVNENDKRKNATKGLRAKADFHHDGVSFMHSYNGAEAAKDNKAMQEKLHSSLDTASLRSMRSRSNSDGQTGIPLSNGIHTFITQRKNSRSNDPAQNTATDFSRNDAMFRHRIVQNTCSASPRVQYTSYSTDSDSSTDGPISPIRAALNAGTFMYRSESAKKREHKVIDDISQHNGQSTRIEQNNNNVASEYTNRARRISDREAEDVDTILSNLKSGSSERSSSSSVADSVGDVDVPSHEDIKNILRQDESYV